MASSAFQSDRLYSNLIKEYKHLHSYKTRYWLYAVLATVINFNTISFFFYTL